MTVECDRGGHAADFVSPEGSNLRSSRPSSSNYLPQKNDTAFVEKGEQGAEGHEKAMATCRQRPGPKQIQAESPDRA